MLEWMSAVCMLVLVATFWPVLKRLLEACTSDTEHTNKPVQVQQQGPPPPPATPTPAAAAAAAPKPPGPQGPGAAQAQAPQLAFICKPSALANYLLQHCKSFCRADTTAAPAWSWRSFPSLQTLFGALWPHESTVHFVRDHLQLTDDGLVALDWAVGGGGASGGAHHIKRRRTSSNSTSPILLIIPNSFGKITRNVLKLCEAALSHGYLPVVFNRRSQNSTPLSTVKLQQFGDPADLREAVRYIRYRQPAGRLYAVSESTGSGLLLSYLGECGSSSYVTAAACLSPIFRCQTWFESGPSWPFNWVLVLYQKMCLSRYRTALSEVIHTDSLFSSSSLRSMEEVLFCQAGLKGVQVEGAWEAYWDRNDPLRDVDEVAIPVLCVCSRDDPVRGESQATLPLELFESNPHFFLLLSAQGGHCGFSMSEEDPMLWSHQALLEFFRATTDFFAAEERSKLAARRRGLGGAGKTFRHRSVSTCKRQPVCSHNIHAIYNWQRSYTR